MCTETPKKSISSKKFKKKLWDVFLAVIESSFLLTPWHYCIISLTKNNNEILQYWTIINDIALLMH